MHKLKKYNLTGMSYSQSTETKYKFLSKQCTYHIRVKKLVTDNKKHKDFKGYFQSCLKKYRSFLNYYIIRYEFDENFNLEIDFYFSGSLKILRALEMYFIFGKLQKKKFELKKIKYKKNYDDYSEDELNGMKYHARFFFFNSAGRRQIRNSCSYTPGYIYKEIDCFECNSTCINIYSYRILQNKTLYDRFIDSNKDPPDFTDADTLFYWCFKNNIKAQIENHNLVKVSLVAGRRGSLNYCINLDGFDYSYKHKKCFSRDYTATMLMKCAT